MATLDIRTTPAGAKIQINGVWEFETTPNRVRVSAGKPIQIKIAQKRFRPHEETLTLGANEQRQLVLDLEPLMGQLEVDSVPSDAVVFIQGRERGRTPVTLSRIPLDKNLRVRVMKDGFKTFDELVDWADAEDGQRLRVKARLEPVRGSDLSERTRKRARRSRSRSGARRSRSGAPRRAARPARPAGRGKLNVVSKPWGQIFVDGRLAHEEGPLIGYELSAGRHRVYVCFQGKRDRCTSPQTVKIRPGETTRLKIQ